MQSEKGVSVVLDTNTIISALLGKDGNPAEVLRRVSSGEVINHISRDILAEVMNVLSRPKIVEKTSEHERHFLLHFIESVSVLVTPKQKLRVIREDEADDRIIECALEAKADFIVSGDKHLLKLQKYKGIRIVDSREFLGLTR